MKELLQRATKINEELVAKLKELEELNKPKVSDLCIFWNYEKTDAVIGKLTGINNKSDIPYEVGSMWSYMHCIKFESMEQYNEFIKE